MPDQMNPEQMPTEGQQQAASADIEMFKTAYQLVKQLVYQKEAFDNFVKEAENNPINAITDIIIAAMLRVEGELGKVPLRVAATIGVVMIDDLLSTLEEIGVMRNSPELQNRILQSLTTMWLTQTKPSQEEVMQELSKEGVSPQDLQAMMQPQQGVPGEEVPGEPMPEQGMMQQRVQ